MELSYKDRGEFLRGFLVLAKMDQEISVHEKSMVKVVGKYFGFEERFCEESANNILENEYISEEPPVFSKSKIAQFFVEECLEIFRQINLVNNTQRVWLQQTLAINGLDMKIELDKGSSLSDCFNIAES